MTKQILVREFEFQHKILDILLRAEEGTVPQVEYNELVKDYKDIPMESMLLLIEEVRRSITRSKNGV